MPTNSKNLHLLISTIIITIIALTYGLLPATTLPLIFDFKVESTDLKEVFRATMGLYIGMAGLWLTGIIKSLLWRSATIANVCFMSGLATGRVISLLIDGIPSISFLIGLALELTLAIWGLRNLNKYQAN
jgi:Domain of unknown function (DUF4345)